MAAIRALRPIALRALRARPPPCALVRHEPTFSPLHTLRPHGSVALATRSSDAAASRDGLRVRLDLHAAQLIDDHREALRQVLGTVRVLPEASARDVRLLQAEIARLGDGFFMLVVAGEYNAGKSSLVNALLRYDVLPEGPTPTTHRVTKLRYADKSVPPVVEEGGVQVMGERVEVLASRLQIVDTPGTNAIDRTHEALTKEFLPLCDVVVFVTSADRPFSESERLFLQSIREWGKKVVMVVNKVDLLDSDDARREVMDFVSSSARTLLGSDSKVFALSARQAKNSSDSRQDEKSERSKSGLKALENYINDELDSGERLRLKLRASASLGTNLAEKYRALLASKKSVVDADLQTIRKIENLLRRHEHTVQKGCGGHFARADAVLMEVLDRADVFFDTHVRLSNAWKLSDRGMIEKHFNDEVVKGTTKSVQRHVQGIGEWLADLSSRNLNETTALFAKREGERASEISAFLRDGTKVAQGKQSSLPLSKFPTENDVAGLRGRERLVTRLSEASEELSSEHLSIKTGAGVADKIASAVRLSAGLGIGAISLFGVYATGAASVAPIAVLGDPTVPAFATALGTLGLAALPRQRMNLRTELKNNLLNTRARLRSELSSRLDEQLSSHTSNIRDALQPFKDFSAQQQLELEGQMQSMEQVLRTLTEVEEKLSSVEAPKVDMQSAEP